MGVKDLTGLRVGKLLVQSLLGLLKGKAMWKCRCDCGNTAIVRGHYLSMGRTKSCGCLKREAAIANLAKRREQ